MFSSGFNGHQKGAALLEVMLSLSLSSLILLTLFQAHSYSQKVLQYGQEMLVVTGLLEQIAHQVWAYPMFYTNIAFTKSNASETDTRCFEGVYCSEALMLQAWADDWQKTIQTRLPNATLSMTCKGDCVAQSMLTISISWSVSDQFSMQSCSLGNACASLDIKL